MYKELHLEMAGILRKTVPKNTISVVMQVMNFLKLITSKIKVVSSIVRSYKSKSKFK